MSLRALSHDLIYIQYLKLFMKVNKKYSFSKDEIENISLQLIRAIREKERIVLSPSKYAKIVNLKPLLKLYSMEGIHKKYSKSLRHNIWFNSPLCVTTLKVFKNA